MKKGVRASFKTKRKFAKAPRLLPARAGNVIGGGDWAMSWSAVPAAEFWTLSLTCGQIQAGGIRSRLFNSGGELRSVLSGIQLLFAT
jgi:hypothetical protein